MIRRTMRRFRDRLPGDRAGNRGFTVLELVVVAAILGLLLAFSSLGGPEVRASRRIVDVARTVASDLRLVRMRAIEQGAPFRVAFSGDAYEVERLSDTDVWEPHPLRGRALTVGAAQSIPLLPPVTVASPVTITFEPRGNTTGTAQVTLRDPEGASYVVDVSFAGQVSTP